MTKIAATLTCSLALALGWIGCGGGHATPKDSTSERLDISAVSKGASAPLVHARPAHRRRIDDAYDGDDGALRHLEEGDDLEVERYGQPSSAAEIRAARVFVKAYYDIAASEDGAAACPLLEPALAQSLGGSFEAPGPAHYLHGKTCAEVMTKLFVHMHRQLVAKEAGVEVTAVRHTQGTVFVLLAFRGMREPRMMGLESHGSGLRLEAIRDSPYP